MTSGRARVAALLLAGSVLAAACGSGDSESGADDATSSIPAPGPAPDPSQPGPAPDPAAPSPGAVPGDAPEVPVPAPATPPLPAGEAPDPPAGAAPDPGPVGPVGSYGPRYLRPSESESVLLQLVVQEGAAPRPAVPDRLRQVLGSLSGKPVAVATAGVAGGPRSWTSDEIRALADGSAPAQSRDRAVLTLLFLRGGFAENERAVGVAVRGDVAAVFAEGVTEAAGVFGDRSAVEDAVALHEVGHLLGLVDLVVDTGRSDPEHPGHSPNRGSVMYYAVESTLLGSVLAGGPPRDFDRDDLDELARIRNG